MTFRLSKEHHPDRSISGNDDKEFVKVNEAYSVLGKALSRREYDQFLEQQQNVSIYYNSIKQQQRSNNYDPRHDPSFWTVRRSKGESYHNSYYNSHGGKRLSNGRIVIFCCLFALVGTAMEMFIVQQSWKVHRKLEEDQSVRNGMMLEYARQQAVRNGFEKQVEKLKDGTLAGADASEITAEYKKTVQEKEK